MFFVFFPWISTGFLGISVIFYGGPCVTMDFRGSLWDFVVWNSMDFYDMTAAAAASAADDDDDDVFPNPNNETHGRTPWFCPGHHLGGMGGELFDNDRGMRLVPCFTWRLDSQNHPRAQNLMLPIKNGNFCVYHAANFQTNSCHVDMRPVSKAPTSSLRVPACTKSVSVDLCLLADVRKSV